MWIVLAILLLAFCFVFLGFSILLFSMGYAYGYDQCNAGKPNASISWLQEWARSKR